jgi:hypothetical protein
MQILWKQMVPHQFYNACHVSVTCIGAQQHMPIACCWIYIVENAWCDKGVMMSWFANSGNLPAVATWCWFCMCIEHRKWKKSKSICDMNARQSRSLCLLERPVWFSQWMWFSINPSDFNFTEKWMHMSAEPSPLHAMTQGIMYSMAVTIVYTLLCIRGLQKGSRMVYTVLCRSVI